MRSTHSPLPKRGVAGFLLKNHIAHTRCATPLLGGGDGERQRRDKMKHYITKYKTDDGKLIVVSWIQINLFGRSYCFSKKELVIQQNN